MRLNAGIKENEHENLVSPLNDLHLPKMGFKWCECILIDSNGYICTCYRCYFPMNTTRGGWIVGVEINVTFCGNLNLNE